MTSCFNTSYTTIVHVIKSEAVID